MYKIFIIEDEVWPFTKKHVESIFGKSSAEVHISTSVKSALIKIWEFSKARRFPDLALIDVRLLKMDKDFSSRMEEENTNSDMDFETFLHQFDHDKNFLKFQESVLKYQNEKGSLFEHGGLYLWAKLHSMAVDVGQKVYSIIYSANTTIHSQASWLKELDFISFMEKSLLGKIVEVKDEDHLKTVKDMLRNVIMEIFKSLYQRCQSDYDKFIKGLKNREVFLLDLPKGKKVTRSPFTIPNTYTKLVNVLQLEGNVFIKDIKLVEQEKKGSKYKDLIVKVDYVENSESWGNLDHEETVSINTRQTRINSSEIEEDEKLVKDLFNKHIIESKITSNDFFFMELRTLGEESLDLEKLKQFKLSGAPHYWTFETLFPTYFVEIREKLENPELQEPQSKKEAFKIFKEVKDKYFPDCYGREINDTFAEGATASATHGYNYKCNNGLTGRNNSDKIDELAREKLNSFIKNFPDEDYLEESRIKEMTFNSGKHSPIKDALSLRDTINLDFSQYGLKDDRDNEIKNFFAFLEYRNYVNPVDSTNIYRGCHNSIILRMNRFKEFLLQLVNDICKDRNGITNKSTSEIKEFGVERDKERKSIHFYFFDDGKYILDENNLKRNSTRDLYKQYKLCYEINWYTVTHLYGKFRIYQMHLQNTEDITGVDFYIRFKSMFPQLTGCFIEQECQWVPSFPTQKEKKWENLHVVEFFYGSPKRA